MSYLRWPLVNAVKMIEYGSKFWIDLIPSFEARRQFYQKANFSDIFYFQFQSTNNSLTDDMVHVYIVNNNNVIVKDHIYWDKVTAAAFTGYTNYEISGYWGLPEGVYFLRVDVLTGTGAVVELISEPVYVKSSHKNTVLISYANNSYNDFDVIFSTGYFKAGGTMFLRLEGGFKSEAYTPGGIYKMYQDLQGQPIPLRKTPVDTFKLSIGSATGIPNYQELIVNRIFCCEEFSIDGVRYELSEGSKPSRSGDPFYPMAGWEIELLKKVNDTSDGYDAVKTMSFTVDMLTPTVDNILLTVDQLTI